MNSTNMVPQEATISVIGAGSYGTALAMALSRNSTGKVILWGHDPEHIERLRRDRMNKEFLPNIDVSFPEQLVLESDLRKAVQASRNLLLVVPSNVFGSVVSQIKPHLRSDSRICWATKGLESKTGRLLQEVITSELGEHYPLAVISGPTFAGELAQGMPTAISAAYTDSTFMVDLQKIVHRTPAFRVYKTEDMVGVQLGGAVKNVIAIGAGMSDGLGYGANARTALITRGLSEIERLGSAMGAKPETFMGMAGLGDLILTCTDDQSRNRRFGKAVGAGADIFSAQKEIGQIVEGYFNTLEVWTLAQRLGISMPIIEQIYDVLYKGKSAKLAAQALITSRRL